VHDFVDRNSDFAAKKVRVLFVYPGPPAALDDHAKDFLAKEADLPANIQLVVDPDYKVTNLYGLRWDAPHETAYLPPSSSTRTERSSSRRSAMSTGTARLRKMC
jgi:hypothetical protein